MAVRVTLKSRLPEVARSLQLRVSQDLKEGSEEIERNASARINNRTGKLDASGEVTGGAGAYRVEFGKAGAYYAKWIELGRKNAPPYPFLVPAAEEEAPRLAAKVTRTLQSL